jgi:hypothetical protein
MNMGFGRRKPVQSVVVAVVLVALVTSLKLFAEPVFGRARFLLYTTAVLLSALIGGRNAGLVATALGSFATAYFFMPMRRGTFSDVVYALLQLDLFFIEGCLVSLIVSRLDNSRFWLNEGAVKNSALLAIAQRARDRTRAENQRLLALIDFYLAGMREPDPNRVMTTAAKLLAEHLGASFVEVYERSRTDSSVFVLRASNGSADGAVDRARLPSGPRTRAGLVLAYGEPLVVEDLRLEKRFDIDSILTERRVFGGMTLPIVWNDRVVGLLGVHTDHRERFGRAQIQFAKSTAEVVGRALFGSSQNAQVA